MIQDSTDLAIVTGASSGIGIEFASELLHHGYRLLLVGRNQQRLEQVQSSLGAESSETGRIGIIAVDLTENSGLQKVLEKSREMGKAKVLVNNAGIGKVGHFLDQEPAALTSMIQTNVQALTHACQLIGAEIANNSGGYILNHASFSAFQSPGSYAVYAATKSYVLTFSLALQQNLRSKNISVTALCSGYFDSGFIQKMGQPTGGLIDWITLEKKKVARAGIRGLFRKRPIVVPSLRYKLLRFFTWLIPKSFLTPLADFIVKSPNDK